MFIKASFGEGPQLCRLLLLPGEINFPNRVPNLSEIASSRSLALAVDF